MSAADPRGIWFREEAMLADFPAVLAWPRHDPVLARCTAVSVACYMADRTGVVEVAAAADVGMVATVWPTAHEEAFVWEITVGAGCLPLSSGALACGEPWATCNGT